MLIEFKKIKVVFFLITFFALTENSFSNSFISNDLYKSPRDSLRYEIDEIRFDSTDAFEKDQLIEILNLKQSNRSIPHSILEYYYDNVKLIKNTPERITKTFRNFLENLSGELGFFNESMLANDSTALWHLYNINGYHFPKISYRFEPSEHSRKNILTFVIDQGTQYRIDTIRYLGIDSLPDHIQHRISKQRKIKR